MDQWLWISKRVDYNEYNDDDLDLVTTNKSSCSGESEVESHNDSVPHEMFFGKEKNILASLEKLSTFVNAFTVCKFCKNHIQVEKDNDRSFGLACFLNIVCQNEKRLKFKINNSVNMSNKNGQFFEINYLCFFVSTAGEKVSLI